MTDTGDDFFETGADGLPVDQLAGATTDTAAELVLAMLDSVDILKTVHASGLHPELIGDARYQEAYQDILSHFAQHSEPMSLDRFQKRHPGLELPERYRVSAKEILLDVMLAAKQRHIATFRLQIDQELTAETGGNINREENLEKIYEGARMLLKQHALWFTSVADRVQTFGDGKDVLKRYDDVRRGVVYGVRIPGGMFQDVMEDMGPLGYGHLTGLFARPGVKKTWALVLMACMVAAGQKNTFIWSSEMEPAELKERAVAMLAQLNFTRFTKGKLADDEFARLKKFLGSTVATMLDKHLFIAGPTAMSTVEDLEIYCADNNIELVCLDNVHTMESRGDEHIKIANLMFDLKYMAIRRRAAVVYTTHQNRYGGSGMEGVAYGDAFNTWSSNMINMKRIDERKVQVNTIKVRSGIGNKQYAWTIDLDKAEFRSMRMQSVGADTAAAPRQQNALTEGL